MLTLHYWDKKFQCHNAQPVSIQYIKNGPWQCCYSLLNAPLKAFQSSSFPHCVIKLRKVVPHWALHIREGELRTLCVQRRPLLVTAGRSSSASTEVMKALHCTLLSVISALWGSFNSVIEQNDPGDQWSVALPGTVSLRSLKANCCDTQESMTVTFHRLLCMLFYVMLMLLIKIWASSSGLWEAVRAFYHIAFFFLSLLHAYLFDYCYRYYFVVFSLIRIRLNK